MRSTIFVSLALMLGIVGVSSKKLKMEDYNQSSMIASLEAKHNSVIRIFKEKGRGHFYINASLGAGQEFNGTLDFMVQGGILNSKTSHGIGFGDLQINDLLFNTENTSYGANFNSNLFGKNVSISLSDASNTVEEFSVDLYFPLPIASSDVNIPSIIEVGSTITWNADSNNSKGVLILIEYNKDRFYLEKGGEKEILVSEDLGSYVFSEKDFEGLNDGSFENNYCLISIIRGDFKMVSNSSNSKIRSKVSYTFSSPWFICRSN